MMNQGVKIVLLMICVGGIMKKRILLKGIEHTAARNSPLRFGAFALGQQEDMWLAHALAQICLRQTSHISRTSAEIRYDLLKKKGLK